MPYVQHMALGTSLAVMVFTSFLRCALIIGTARGGLSDCAPLCPGRIVLGTLLEHAVGRAAASRELRWFLLFTPT